MGRGGPASPPVTKVKPEVCSMFSFHENKRTAEICRSLQKELILVQACSHSPLFSPICYEYHRWAVN
jgi:hypothetical protein